MFYKIDSFIFLRQARPITDKELRSVHKVTMMLTPGCMSVWRRMLPTLGYSLATYATRSLCPMDCLPGLLSAATPSGCFTLILTPGCQARYLDGMTAFENRCREVVTSEEEVCALFFGGDLKHLIVRGTVHDGVV